MIEVIQQNAAIFIAGIAVLLSAVANWRVVRAEKEANKTQKSVRRMNKLIEFERKSSAIDKLMLITAQKILLIERSSEIINAPVKEIKRLKNNLLVLQGLKNGEEKQHRLLEMVGGGQDIERHLETLTDIRRLRIRIEADLEKETNIYNELLEKEKRINT